FICGLLAFGAIVFGPGSGNANVTAALFTGLVLVLLTWWIASRIARRDNNPILVPIIVGGFCLRIIGALIRYWVGAILYASGDFSDYDRAGQKFAASLRHGSFVLPPGRLAGTNFLRVVTGLLYTVTPARLMSGFFVFSWLSFLGMLFFWRAFRTAISPKWDLS